MKTMQLLGIVLAIIVVLGAVIYLKRPGAAEEEKVKAAVIYVTPIEEPWNTVLHEAMTWAVENLGIEYVYTEKVDTADVERVVREYIAEGYNLIFTHSWGYNEVTRRLAQEFPDIYFCQGSGPTDVEWPPNVILYDYWIQDAAYLAGVTAGLLTKTDVIGVVTAYAVPDVNRLVNAYCAGAKSVNPDVEIKVIFIESWFDPVKAKEAALAEIEAGADIIYAERYGVFEAFKEAGIEGYAFGNIVDQSSLAPDVVLGSVAWDLHTFVEYVINMVKSGNFQGGIVDWGMKEGWAKFIWNEELKKQIPSEVVQQVEEVQQKIIAGEIEVPVYEDWDPNRWAGGGL